MRESRGSTSPAYEGSALLDIAVLPEGYEGPPLTDDQHALYVALKQRPEVAITIQRYDLKELGTAYALREYGLISLKLNQRKDVYEARAA